MASVLLLIFKFLTERDLKGRQPDVICLSLVAGVCGYQMESSGLCSRCEILYHLNVFKTLRRGAECVNGWA